VEKQRAQNILRVFDVGFVEIVAIIESGEVGVRGALARRIRLHLLIKQEGLARLGEVDQAIGEK